MRPWQQVPCLRLSPSGELTVTFRYPGEEVELWLSFCRRHHKGDALIVGDEVRELGTFPDLVEVATALNGRTGQRAPRYV